MSLNQGSTGSSKWLTFVTDKLTGFAYFLNALKGVFGITLVQTKFLSGNWTTNNSDIPELQCNNLVVGKFYTIEGLVRYSTTIGTADNADITWRSEPNNGGSIYGRTTGVIRSGDAPRPAISFTFKAESETMYAYVTSLDSNSTIIGNGTRQETHLTIQEHPNHVETNKF